jgi:superoxide dismutase, Fe-Mn family
MALELPPLPFAPNALEPHISAETVRLHHENHEAGYVKKTNAIAAELRLSPKSMEEAIAMARARAHTGLFNVAAQAWNHWFYWRSLRSGGGGRASGPVAALIDKQLGGYDAFAKKLHEAATAQFGSGWAWLVIAEGRLAIKTTANAEQPAAHEMPLLVVDVWEHAYYVDYRDKRAAYVTAVIEHLIDWDSVNSRMLKAAAAPAPRAANA